ncbi:MAG TPA: lipocalin-like domain-containing protein [Terriglobales bacterium]|nr:lipocalin-like domain-containing protein [Terriglobales bacterium]
MGQSENQLVGSWELVSASSVTRSGERNETPYGVRPLGLLIYASDGRITSLISYGERKPLSMNATPEEQAEAFNTFLAYTGRYSVNGDKIIHHIQISSVQNYVGKDLVRTVKLDGNRLTLTTPPTMVNGKFQSIELNWQRLPGEAAVVTTT